jgi:hypothetical protein
MHQRRHRPCLQRRAEVIWWAADRLRALGGLDGSYAIAIDAVGSAYLTGATSPSNFPVRPGAFQTTYGGGGSDGYVTKLNPAGTALVYSTYLGGSGGDAGVGIAIDSSGNAFVTGGTGSTNFPTVNPVQPNYAGGSGDAFVTELNPLGTGLVFSTYLGGSGDDSGQGIALDTLPNPNVYLSGDTSSTDFPTTSGGLPDHVRRWHPRRLRRKAR